MCDMVSRKKKLVQSTNFKKFWRCCIGEYISSHSHLFYYYFFFAFVFLVKKPGFVLFNFRSSSDLCCCVLFFFFGSGVACGTWFWGGCRSSQHLWNSARRATAGVECWNKFLLIVRKHFLLMQCFNFRLHALKL